MKITIDDIKICECLTKIIKEELRIGNYIRSFDETPEWPKKNSRFVFLNEKIKPQSLVNIPAWISVRVNTDMHYTWYNEVYCKHHKDLLAAGDM